MEQKRNLERMKYLQILTKNFLEKEYLSNKKSLSQLSKELKKDKATIKYYLQFHNIKVRTHKEQAVYSSKGSGYKFDKLLTKEFLLEEYVNKNKGIKDLSKELKFDYGTIRRYLRKYDLPMRSAKQQKNLNNPPKEFDLNDKTMSLIDGLLLGDASIPKRKNGVAPRSLTQGCKHEEYLIYIKKQLAECGVECSPILSRWLTDARCKNKGYFQSFLQTLRYKTFEVFRKRWYVPGRKVIPRDLKINKTILLHCFLCDGNFYREIKLCTNGFSKDDVLLLKNLIEEELYIRTRLVRMKNDYEIAIKKSDASKFLEYVGHCPVKCYEYKWKDNESEEAKKRKRLLAKLTYQRNKYANFRMPTS